MNNSLSIPVPAWLPIGPVLVIGANGQVGSELVKSLSPLGQVVAVTHQDLDLCNTDKVRRLVRDTTPRWIVNAAAYTAVDKAESEPELALAINAHAVEILAYEAKRTGAVIIHFSTDYVFNGAGETPFTETDTPSPINFYGASKLAGERALAASGAAYLVFRTSWVFGATGKNFLVSILKLAREREVLQVVSDQHGSPTWSRDLAEMTAHVIRSCEDGARPANLDGRLATGHVREDDLPSALRTYSGIYHATGSGTTTWYDFARSIIDQMSQLQPAARYAAVQPVSSEQYAAPAQRPANSRLDCKKLQQTFHWTMPSWQQSLQQVLAEVHSGIASPQPLPRAPKVIP